MARIVAALLLMGDIILHAQTVVPSQPTLLTAVVSEQAVVTGTTASGLVLVSDTARFSIAVQTDVAAGGTVSYTTVASCTAAAPCAADTRGSVVKFESIEAQ